SLNVLFAVLLATSASVVHAETAPATDGALGSTPVEDATGPAGAATANAPSQRQVAIVDFAFQPGSVTVRVGDTVVWTNDGALVHTATSDAGVWDTGRLTAGQSGSFTFTAPGTFSYLCAVHPG